MYQRSLLTQNPIPFNIGDLVRRPHQRQQQTRAGNVPLSSPRRQQHGRRRPQLHLQRGGSPGRRGHTAQQVTQQDEMDEDEGWPDDEDEDEDGAEDSEMVTGEGEDEEEGGRLREEEALGGGLYARGIALGATQAGTQAGAGAGSQYFAALQREGLDSQLDDFLVDDEEEEEDGNDSWCSCCRGGGDLLCCDGCSNAYHLGCVGIAEVPSGSWYCPECKLERRQRQRRKEQKAGRLAGRRAGRQVVADS
jgi:hypothetical protein